MFRQPVVVYTGTADKLAAVRERALRRRMPAAIYTDELFGTSNDDNRAAVRAADPDRLRLAGIAVYGPRNGVDKVCKGLVLHP